MGGTGRAGRRPAATVLAAGLTLFFSAGALAGPATGEVPAPTPPGFVSFCVRHPDQCDAPPGGSNSIALTDDRWRTIRDVNHEMNESIRPEDDETHYGRPEYWEIPTDGYGDCEDYALAKRKALIDRGFPELALRIAIVITPENERHAVLLVETDKGQYVLDNLIDAVLERRQSDYVWIEEQDAHDPRAWVFMQPAPQDAQPSAVAAVK
jgi:predicted transglutaminase-like cysteine proteinase